MKKCTKCKIEKPATSEYFYKKKKHKDGLSYTCKDCDREYNKKYYQKNIEYHREHNKNYRQENRDYFREYGKNYRQENQEYHAEYNRKYYRENREELSEYSVIYHLENPEVNRLNAQRRRERMAQLPHTLTLEEWEDALEYFNHSCAYCGVSDDNLGREHVIPVIKGGGYTADNIIPACRTCNASKHTRNMEEWYLSYEHYDEGRLNKILDYIEVMEEI